MYGDDDDRLGFWLTRELGERFDDGNFWHEFRCVNPVNSELLLEELGLRFDYEFLSTLSHRWAALLLGASCFGGFGVSVGVSTTSRQSENQMSPA